MSTQHTEILRDITKNVHEMLLKSLGFRKKGNTFNHISQDGLVEVISFQSGRYEPFAKDVPGFHYPNALYGSFTVNLGIFVPEYTLGKDDKSFVQEYSCAIRNRIGGLYGNREDKWFKIENPEATSKIVIELIRDYGVPFLEKFNTREKIITNIPEKSENRFSTPSLILLAKIHYKKGDKEKARSLLKMQYDETTTNDAHKSYVKSLAETLEIPIN